MDDESHAQAAAARANKPESEQSSRPTTKQRGWYIAQGFTPAGTGSIEDDKGACQLPDGVIVCGVHGRVVCGVCGVDYSAMDDEGLANALAARLERLESEQSSQAAMKQRGAQGFTPTGTGNIEDDNGCQLPNGVIVCGVHGRVVCGECGVDYSAWDDEGRVNTLAVWLKKLELDKSSRSEIESDTTISTPPSPQSEQGETSTASNQRASEGVSAGPKTPDSSIVRPRIRGTGRVFPTKFCPPSPTTIPSDIFESKANGPGIRGFIHRNTNKTALFFTTGVCRDNGTPEPKAGWAVIHSPRNDDYRLPQLIIRRLEAMGPFGDPGIQDSNRAELRAIVGALRSRDWSSIFDTLVIATDSAYVTTGATEWARNWIKKGWRTSAKKVVKNKDMWEALLGEVEWYEERGVSIQLWKLYKTWNSVAIVAANLGAMKGDAPPSVWRG
ncbi:ribonuclease H-like domain-containing protein [Xylaria palmicola]|nr:ribonuclease H-like domain-containing protein [Xylaria palmicola]